MKERSIIANVGLKVGREVAIENTDFKEYSSLNYQSESYVKKNLNSMG